MKWFFAFLLMAFPALAQTLLPSPLDVPTTKLHSPKHKAFLESLGTPMVTAAAVPAVAAAPPAVIGALMWNYPAEQITNVLFDVYHSTSPAAGPPLTRYDQIPSGFTLLITVTGPPVPVGGFMQEFFIVRARDIVSGVVSNWNQP